MPQIFTIILVLIGVMAVFAVVFWILIKKAMLGKSDDKSNDRTALMLQDQLKEMRDAIHKTNLDIRNTLDNRIGESTKAMQSQIGHSAKIISEVTEKINQVGRNQQTSHRFCRSVAKFAKYSDQPKTKRGAGRILP